MTATAARTTGPDGGHWYKPDGTPAYEVPYADPKKGVRKTTLADAKKLGLLPSTTTILRALHKQALVDWLIEQACLAVLTTPRQDGEELDAFVNRVLHVEKVQDQESEAARDRGTAIHDAMENRFKGLPVDDAIWLWAAPAYLEIAKRGEILSAETVVVGGGYAGRVDLIQETPEAIWIWDWKTTKRLPSKGAYQEHTIQAASYAAALAKDGMVKPIKTGNVYISTVECGQFIVCEHEHWQPIYENCWKPLLKVWCYLNGYDPTEQ